MLSQPDGCMRPQKSFVFLAPSLLTSCMVFYVISLARVFFLIHRVLHLAPMMYMAGTMVAILKGGENTLCCSSLFFEAPLGLEDQKACIALAVALTLVSVITLPQPWSQPLPCPNLGPNPYLAPTLVSTLTLPQPWSQPLPCPNLGPNPYLVPTLVLALTLPQPWSQPLPCPNLGLNPYLAPTLVPTLTLPQPWS